ncbi:hypothetical protein P3706_26630, partial [Vibrio parahaemolyticus]|nr:hypothetical protein [Vibrio parahaemolyticus]
SLTLYAGKRKLGLKPSDLDNFRGERGRRGGLLPRGLQRVTRIEVELDDSDTTETPSDSE